MNTISVTITIIILAISNLLYAQNIGDNETPTLITTKNFNIDDTAKKLYTIQYAIQLQERVMPDSTKFTDTLLTKRKETNALFNDNGYLTSYTIDSFDEKGKNILNTTTIYSYNNNKIAAIQHYEDNKLIDSTAIEYDRHDLMDKQVFYDKKKRKTKTIEYFHRRGKIFNVKIRDEKGMLVNFIRYEHDSLGNLREQEIKGNTMQYQNSIKYEYDTLSDGNIQVNIYDYVGQYEFKKMVSFLKDPHGNTLEQTVADSNKRVIDHRTMTYNNKNLVTSALIFKELKYDYTYKYTYNEKGYWSTQYMYEADKPISKTHRVIEYEIKE